MDASNLLLTEAVLPPKPLNDLAKTGSSVSQQKKEQIAKDFEAVFIDKILEQMKESIGDWGFEKDAAMTQVQGIFWMHLARDIANNGGFGLWKDIYKFLTASETKAPAVELPKSEI